MAYDVLVPPRVLQQVANIPDEATRSEMANWIKKLATTPRPEHHSKPIVGVHNGFRLKVHNFRMLYLVLPRHKTVYVGDVVIRDEYTYSRVRLARLTKMARKNPPKTSDLSVRIRAILDAHPDWGAVRVAEVAKCSPTAVRKRRVAWDLPSGIKLPWLNR